MCWLLGVVGLLAVGVFTMAYTARAEARLERALTIQRRLREVRR